MDNLTPPVRNSERSALKTEILLSKIRDASSAAQCRQRCCRAQEIDVRNNGRVLTQSEVKADVAIG